MRLLLFGPTEIRHDDGTPVPLGGARLRALLTVLALRPGRAVTVAHVVAEVWDGDPPADAPGAVQALVGRLRRAIGRDAVESVAGGYRLRAGADDVDVHRFDRLAGEGIRAFESGDAAGAADLLDQALGLWRGPVLADLPDRAAPAARWEARRLDARRTRLAAALALGRAEEALPELTALCADHPIDESLQTLRLTALEALGRPAEALAAYETFRRRLASDLGADPSPSLQELHRALLAPPAPNGTAPAPRTDTNDPAPETPQDIPGPGLGAPPPAARGNLRARLTSFVGREADMETLRADLGTARLVTLLGSGGSGKTRLAQEVAEQLGDRAPDGVWMAELAPVHDPDTVAEAVLTALGARQTVLRGAGAEELRAAEGHSDDPLDLLTEHCARRRMLLVLDNCEHVVAAAATLAERLLQSCPGLTVLATSREALGVPGELVRPLEPLPAPTALRLFAERGAQARPGFTTDDDPEACAEICRRLDGLPLAIELAAARLRLLAPRQIADRLDNRFRLLTSGSRTALPRQQTLRAVVDWSWDLLEAPERAVLRRLSVFAGGCDLPAAEAVCPDDHRTPDQHDIADVLGSLVDKSLVIAAPTGPGGGMRYRLLDTVAAYASARLDEAAERPATERRHLVHFRELARTTDPLLRGSGQLAALDLFSTEYGNLRTALRRAIDAHDEDEALILVLSLSWYWHMRDLRAEARHWSTLAGGLGLNPFAPPVAPAPPVHERCTDHPPPLDPTLLWEARRGVALLRVIHENSDIGEWTTKENLSRMRGVTDAYRPGLPQTCRHPGLLWFFAHVVSGDGAGLLGMLNETVDACRRHGYDWELATALQTRANVLANRSHWAGDATRDADEALALFTRLGDLWGAAEALSARGEGYERSGRYRLAADDFTTAISYAERIGAQLQVGVFRARLGGLLLELGEEERGEALLRETLAEHEATVNECTAACRIFLTLRLGRTGRRDEARAMAGHLIDQFGASSLAIFEGMVIGLLAWLDLGDGRPARALEQAREALRRADDALGAMVAPQLASTQLVTMATALIRLGPGRARDAARLLGASDTRLPPGHFSTSHEVEARTGAEAEVRAVLADAEYADAYAEGTALTVMEAGELV
ncbi:AfsR/SARP family transcriptional regulator [Streptomyces yaizuensis]|uniref:Winged helix-turn-helix domain-containing protein n=1 Tax=Streptomyces yaizuensis TaxID=2989713 RepID=A0ABQ5NUE7_9ACTN|nr:BTAD domain-containing putative transcriptional regulator [Streptomyces sp. YSPA8]GLF93989.1 winged helix-turn-helix domain-containing protein [Streptomyces sp. YSPA8]